MSGNKTQIDDWNGDMGARWVQLQRETDRVVGPFGVAALAAAAPQRGERVIDIGCGCGETTFDLADRVGPGGHVLGLDVSRPMLAVADAQPRKAGAAPIEFREGDASAAPLPAGTDLLYSRFGTMFFDEPVAALAHLRAALKPGGRMAFVAWRTPRDNPWGMVPLMAARKALGVEPPPMDPNAPGPFAFADKDRVEGLLAQAGFVDIELRRHDAAVPVGSSPRAATDLLLRIGPTARLLREAGPQHAATVRDAVEGALAAHTAADGGVALSGSTWIVTARNP
jgi:SAM-dependent methyltransferase